MKKSQLKNIIRESIKELMTEQAVNGRYVSVYSSGGCENMGTNNPGMAYSAGTGAFNDQFQPALYGTICMTVNGGQVPQEGQKIMIGGVEKVIKLATTHPYCSGNSNPCTPGTLGCPPSFNGYYNPPGSAGTVGNFPDHQTVGDCLSGPGPSGCDNTMNGSCAQQWLPPNMNWPNMTSFACTGTNTFLGLANNMSSQFSQYPTVTGNPQNWNQISQMVNAAGLQQPQKGQVKRKLAKAFWANCMKTECQC